MMAQPTSPKVSSPKVSSPNVSSPSASSPNANSMMDSLCENIGLRSPTGGSA